jgi:hypothetical protein
MMLPVYQLEAILVSNFTFLFSVLEETSEV